MRIYYNTSGSNLVYRYWQYNSGQRSWDTGKAVKYRLSAYGYHAAYWVSPSCR